MPRLETKPVIESIKDLEDYIYWAIGTIDMEDVRVLLDVIKNNRHLLEEHK
jgi:hypothetical protein